MTIPSAQISPQHQADITRVIEYWFSPITPTSPVTEKWFMPPDREKIDNEIRTAFGPLVEQARTSSTLDTWTSTPQGALALLILLDQYPRNIYRGSHLSHAADDKAVDVAIHAIARDFDRSKEISHLQSIFFYMPLMHAETLAHQVAGIALFEALAARCADSSTASGVEREGEREEVVKFVQKSLWSARVHRDVILRFGRFPSRNEILGRESTGEEVEFLRENPMGFPSPKD
jgi:uncharacterized protein (DUF924 family)